MSFSESHFEENPVTPLIDVIQLISFPIVAFSVVTPLCMWSGYSIPVSFLMGWVFGLGAMVALIVVVYALCTVQKLRDAAQQQHCRQNAPILQFSTRISRPTGSFRWSLSGTWTLWQIAWMHRIKEPHKVSGQRLRTRLYHRLRARAKCVTIGNNIC